ncbi:GNAT family N-acetyltransferase [Trinickia mobilis]|uniref:GNAT family N-acetyltransferase n=1 Tax=Trinickia mobilis TaxID=2816356 RepID=UPI001A8D3274|nr:GNAT family N-acetyltransferase [Trinickia mobilis]
MLTLRCSENEFLAEDDEPSRFIFEYDGKLLLPDRADEETDVGYFSVKYVDVGGAVTERESVFDVFDSDSTCIQYYEALYDGNDDIKPRVARLAHGDDYLWNPSLLILDRLVVYREYRGRGVGLVALRALIHRFRAGAGLIALKAFPLQYEGDRSVKPEGPDEAKLGYDQFHVPMPKATSKLRSYYRQVGFLQVPRTQVMVRSPEVPVRDVTSNGNETSA